MSGDTMNPTMNIAVLGSTGSIGRNTLDVIARHPDRYRVTALTAHRNAKRLAEQCQATAARYAVIEDQGRVDELATHLAELGCDTEILTGAGAQDQLVASDEVDTVMAAIVGAAGLQPTLAATRAGKRILLANKESMVIAGPLFARAVATSGARIIPVDSEHNALFQALPEHHRDGLEAAGVDRLILTASGGPFLATDPDTLSNVTPEQACNHPRWKMGRKISVDSATLMNKGLEVIEARWLFNAQPGQIEVLIHPQSIVHSMVAYRDGSVLAQLGMPDMRTPIAHALAWPERIEAGVERLDLATAGPLEFQAPDFDRFPCLRLAFEALEAGEGAAVVLNAANEVAVQAFLDEQISFMEIPELVERTLAISSLGDVATLEDVLDLDRETRRRAREMMNTKEVVSV